MRAGRGAESWPSLGPLLERVYSLHVFLAFGFVWTWSPAALSGVSVYPTVLPWF